MSRVHYLEFAPHPALARHVECYWSRTADPDPTPQRVLPDGAMDFVIQLGERGDVSVVGAMTRPLVLAQSAPSQAVGVRFRPGGLAGFLPEHAGALTDRSEPLRAVAGLNVDDLCDRLRAHTDARTRVLQLERALLTNLSTAAPLDEHVLAAVQRIEATGGRTRSAELVEHVGLGERQLERRFLARVGLTPKFFAKVTRFRAAQRLASRDPRAGWAGVAALAGYCDQAHLIRDFGALAGLSPAAWLKSELSNTPAPPHAKLRA